MLREEPFSSLFPSLLLEQRRDYWLYVRVGVEHFEFIGMAEFIDENRHRPRTVTGAPEGMYRYVCM